MPMAAAVPAFGGAPDGRRFIQYNTGATISRFQAMYHAPTRACDRPARVIHWYRCSRCGRYQRRPHSIRDSKVQLASATNADAATTPLHAAVYGEEFCQIMATAIKNPTLPLPTSPMNARARGKLNGRKPATATAHSAIWNA